MTTDTKANLKRHGYKEDTDNQVLSDLFKSNDSFKMFHVTITDEENDMMLSRFTENNVNVNFYEGNCGKRLVVDKNDTILMDILVDKINDSMFVNYSSKKSQFEFYVNGMQFSVFIRS